MGRFFCIIQDDPEDKAIEISQMPRTYGQAMVTILAARSGAADVGFLQSRRQVQNVIQIPFRSSSDELGFVYLCKYEDVRHHYEPEPLDLRAGAMQERLLSPRVIEVGILQSRWTCRTNTFANTDGWTQVENVCR